MVRILPVLVLLSACVAVPEATVPGARFLAMGDSVMAWNRGQGASIVDVAEKVLGEEIVDASVPGARLESGGVRAALGLSIPDQYRDGDWDAVVLNGGANDLYATCGCRSCAAELDELIGPDGTGGRYPDLLAAIPAPVFVLGYYGPVRGGGGSYDACDDELRELERRLARLAAANARVTLVSVRQVMDGAPALYDADKVHPSPEGSARIGAHLGGVMRDRLRRGL